MSLEGARVVLARTIEGAPRPEHFRVERFAVPEPGEGEALIRNVLASVDPGTRSRLGGGPSYTAPVAPGEVIGGFNVGVVTRSRHPRLPEGTVLTHAGGWSDYTLTNGRGYLMPVTRADLPLSLWIGVLGVPGMTAWFGLTRVAEIKAGARVLVTSAAGPVGATAGQLAKHLGAARVAGIAGGAEKCAWITQTAGFDAAIDYRAEGDLSAAIARAMPDGIDILFDNVGNAMIETVLPMMRTGGRIVVSGQVADYNVAPADTPGIRFTRPFITHRVRMEGLVVFDDLKQFPEAQARVGDLIAAGKLAYREEHFEGIETMGDAFCGLFTGASFGRRIVRLGPDPEGL